jgi:hypothetical protein
MKYIHYLFSLFFFGVVICNAQAPLLLPTRNLAEELTTQTSLGWRGMFLAGSAYQPVEEQWLTDNFLPKFKKIVARLRMKTTNEGFNCKDFAALFKTQLQMENHLAGNSRLGEVACAILVVEQRRSFGRVLSLKDSLHALILVRTENGWRVIEPQTMRLATLDRYPNRSTMQAVYF